MDVGNVTSFSMVTLKLQLFTWFWNMDRTFLKDTICGFRVEFVITKNRSAMAKILIVIANRIMIQLKGTIQEGLLPVPNRPDREDRPQDRVVDLGQGLLIAEDIEIDHRQGGLEEETVEVVCELPLHVTFARINSEL